MSKDERIQQLEDAIRGALIAMQYAQDPDVVEATNALASVLLGTEPGLLTELALQRMREDEE